jgi:isopentenyl-diphosphate Delta-isomerase
MSARQSKPRDSVAESAAPVEQVILVDELDRELGVSEKLAAHRAGMLHRAFSIFIFDRDKRLLLQKRAQTKYHSAGLWSNTVCGHPRPGEPTAAAAHRRLQEEMRFDCRLRPAFQFLYRVELAGALIEHEYDHVFVGQFNREPAPDPAEVEDWLWVRMDELKRDLEQRPEAYSYWLRVALTRREWQQIGALMRME